MNREQLNQIRKEKRLSLEKMERDGNLSLGTLKNFFYGNKRPQLETAEIIAKLLGVSVDDILYDDVEDIKETIEEMENPDAVSVIALKRLYEFQIESITAIHELEKEEMKKQHDARIAEIKQFYEQRLSDKNEHIATILLDKKWFRLAAVVGVCALLAVFFFIEFMTPGHGWFTFGKYKKHPCIGCFIIPVLFLLRLLLFTYLCCNLTKKGCRK
jgi:transcriptional regulator with XRE-family HTH domain